MQRSLFGLKVCIGLGQFAGAFGHTRFQRLVGVGQLLLGVYQPLIHFGQAAVALRDHAKQVNQRAGVHGVGCVGFRLRFCGPGLLRRLAALDGANLAGHALVFRQDVKRQPAGQEAQQFVTGQLPFVRGLLAHGAHGIREADVGAVVVGQVGWVQPRFTHQAFFVLKVNGGVVPQLIQQVPGLGNARVAS